jgi:hypothetical protein
MYVYHKKKGTVFQSNSLRCFNLFSAGALLAGTEVQHELHYRWLHLCIAPVHQIDNQGWFNLSLGSGSSGRIRSPALAALSLAAPVCCNCVLHLYIK